MSEMGILNGDLLIVDRLLQPRHNDIVVAAIAGDLTCKILDKKHQRLLAANPAFRPIPILNEQSLVIEGVVKASIRYHRKQPC